MLLKLNVRASNNGSVFFGFYFLLIGYLVFRSAFLPRILGVLMMLAGVAVLTSCIRRWEVLCVHTLLSALSGKHV